MYDVFKSVVQFNIQACFLVLAVIILRLLLRKAPRSLICALWTLVAIRLIFPFHIESIFSLMPDTETAARNVGSYATERITSAVWEYPETFLHTTDNMVIKEKTDTLWNILPRIAAGIWAAGVAVMLIYAIVSYLRLYRMTRENMMTEKGVYICDRIPSPFILGVFRPKIFLPSNISEQDKPYVLAHEKAHIKRKDHFWKPLGFLLLSVYWFNPLLWVAYILLCRDIESACDEKVIKELGSEIKKPYAIALINSAATQKLISACPIAFGETSVKSRIKNVLNYKKPAFWVIVIAVILSIAVAVCFLTNPVSKESREQATPDSSAKISPSENLPDKLEPQEAVDRFFKLNYENFSKPPTQSSDWTWKTAKTVYYGGTYLDGTWQVILLTDISGVDTFEPVSRGIRYEKCAYSYQELNDAIDSINRKRNTILYTKESGYSDSIVQLRLLDDQNKVEIGIADMNEDKVNWFKDTFGDQDYLVFRNITALPNDDIADVNITDVPRLIFANERVVYISGDCGIIFYDIVARQFIGRISLKYIQDLGIQQYWSYTDPDGRYIYIDDYADSDRGMNHKAVFDMTTGMITSLTSSSESIPESQYFQFDKQDYDVKYSENGQNISERIYQKGNVEYRISVPGWKIENMELTVKNLKSGTEKAYRIFE